MGDITKDILCSSEEFKPLINEHQVSFTTRIGAGRATYCKYKHSTGKIIITYGKKMIASKHHPFEATQWLSYREIIKRNYFHANTSLSNLLAHTICHEFTHAIQQIQGLVFKGSIHNSHFYQILDQLHEAGLGEDVQQALDRQCKLHSINLTYNNREDDLLPVVTPVFQLYDKIQFKHRNKLITARIIKINPKTLTVESKGLFKTTLWRVSKYRASHC